MVKIVEEVILKFRVPGIILGDNYSIFGRVGPRSSRDLMGLKGLGHSMYLWDGKDWEILCNYRTRRLCNTRGFGTRRMMTV